MFWFFFSTFVIHSLRCHLSSRHRDIFWPIVPDPSVIFKQMMNGNNDLMVKSRAEIKIRSFPAIPLHPLPPHSPLPLIALCFSDSRRERVHAGARNGLPPASSNPNLKKKRTTSQREHNYLLTPHSNTFNLLQRIPNCAWAELLAGGLVKLFVSCSFRADPLGFLFVSPPPRSGCNLSCKLSAVVTYCVNKTVYRKIP